MQIEMINEPNKRFTLEEVAKEIGCTPEELEKIAYENGLIDENGNPTELAIKEGYLSNYVTVEDDLGEAPLKM